MSIVPECDNAGHSNAGGAGCVSAENIYRISMKDDGRPNLCELRVSRLFKGSGTHGTKHFVPVLGEQFICWLLSLFPPKSL